MSLRTVEATETHVPARARRTHPVCAAWSASSDRADRRFRTHLRCASDRRSVRRRLTRMFQDGRGRARSPLCSDRCRHLLGGPGLVVLRRRVWGHESAFSCNAEGVPIRVWTNHTARPLVEAALTHVTPDRAQEFQLLNEGSDLRGADAVVVEITGGLPAGLPSVAVPVLDLDTGTNERRASTMETHYPPQTRSSYGSSDRTSSEKRLASDLQEVLESTSSSLTIGEIRSLERLVFELRDIAEADRRLSEADRRNLELRTQQLEAELRADRPARRIVSAVVSQVPGFITGLLTNATFAFVAGL